MGFMAGVHINPHTANFPSAVLEVSEDEVKEWLSPKHLMIGKTVNIMGRRLLM